MLEWNLLGYPSMIKAHIPVAPLLTGILELLRLTMARLGPFVANTGSNTVSIVSLSSPSVMATIPVGSYPMALAVSASGSTAYVGNYGANSVSVINLSLTPFLLLSPLHPHLSPCRLIA